MKVFLVGEDRGDLKLDQSKTHNPYFQALATIRKKNTEETK